MGTVLIIHKHYMWLSVVSVVERQFVGVYKFGKKEIECIYTHLIYVYKAFHILSSAF